MTTRRDFLKAGAAAGATGIVFCSCGLLHSAHAQQSGRQTLPVMVDGKPVKTIDIHSHCHFREAGALLGADAEKYQLPPVNGASEAFIEIDKRLAAMDSQAVDMEVLSINPFWYDRERDLAGQIVKIQNEKLAELCASKPDRFAAFASLTLQAPDLAVQELETAVKKQGLKGAAIGGVVNGVEFSDPKFHSVWAKAEELGVPLFIHPQGVPELNKRFSGNGWLVNTIGNPLETTVALSHLIFEGTFDRFPGLKVIAAHGGGFLPSYADRSDHACLVSPKGCNPDIKLKKQPTEYLKQIYFDSLIFSPEAIRHLAAQVGASQIVLGSDYPYPWQLQPVDHIFASALSDDDKANILGRTAAKLLDVTLNSSVSLGRN
jgi:aminocarboxymuconate-semialdehyde decarboxylase